MSRDRLLIIDADLPRRLVPQLTQRARNAIHVQQLGLANNVKDPDVLRGLAENYNDVRDWVLVSGDDAMPAEHGDVIIETMATVAIVHPFYPEGVTEHAWRMDIVQRWAHAIQLQQPQTVRRYALNGGRPWTPRRRHVLNIARFGWTPWRPEDAQKAAEARGDAEESTPPLRLPGLE